MTLLVEKIGFPRADISRIYPVKSGFCIELAKSSLREQLAQKAATHGLLIEPETVTHAYLLSNVPESIRAYDGSDRPTGPLIAEEIEVITKQKAQVQPLNTPGSYLIILKHKVPPFSVFGSDPAKLLPRKPRIYTCSKCFGFHHDDKCRYNPVCAACGGPRGHEQHKPIPQCPNCLGPATPGHQDCPTKPKVWQGKVSKPTKEQRTSIRRAGRAAYRSKLRELDADRDSQETSQPTAALSESMDAEPLPSRPSHQPPEVMMEAQATITDKEHDAGDLTDSLTPGRPPVSRHDRSTGAQLSRDSPEVISVLDEHQHTRRGTATRRPARARAISRHPMDSPPQPPSTMPTPLSSPSPPSVGGPIRNQDRPPTPIGDTIVVRY